MELRRYTQGAELEPLVYEHRRNGTAVDFTDPSWSSFTLGIALYADRVPITTGGFPKTTGITALADGIQVDWSTTTELNDLDPGVYVVQLRATHSSGRGLDLAEILIDLEPSLV